MFQGLSSFSRYEDMGQTLSVPLQNSFLMQNLRFRVFKHGAAMTICTKMSLVSSCCTICTFPTFVFKLNIFLTFQNELFHSRTDKYILL